MIDPEQADREMGRPPTTIKSDGTRVYMDAESEGRIPITIYHPNGSISTATALSVAAPTAEKDLRRIGEIFSPHKEPQELQRVENLTTEFASDERKVKLAEGERKRNLEFGYIKQMKVRLWAMAHITPKPSFLSKTTKDPYYQAFWIESITIQKALDQARQLVEEFPAVINLYIANSPIGEPIAVGYAPNRERWAIIQSPNLITIPKPEPSKLLIQTVSAIAGTAFMIALSILWPREMFKFSWLLSIAAIGTFMLWRRYGDSSELGRMLNIFRPATQVNILEDWAPRLFPNTPPTAGFPPFSPSVSGDPEKVINAKLSPIARAFVVYFGAEEPSDSEPEVHENDTLENIARRAIGNCSMGYIGFRIQDHAGNVLGFCFKLPTRPWELVVPGTVNSGKP